MPSFSLTGWGMSLRTMMGRLMNFFLYSIEKLGGSLETSFNSSSMTFAHHSRLSLYAYIVLTWDFYWDGLDLVYFGAATIRVCCCGLLGTTIWFGSNLVSGLRFGIGLCIQDWSLDRSLGYGWYRSLVLGLVYGLVSLGRLGSVSGFGIGLWIMVRYCSLDSGSVSGSFSRGLSGSVSGFDLVLVSRFFSQVRLVSGFDSGLGSITFSRGRLVSVSDVGVGLCIGILGIVGLSGMTRIWFWDRNLGEYSSSSTGSLRDFIGV